MSSGRLQPGALLQPLEAGLARVVEDHHLAVDDDVVVRAARHRARDLGKRRGESLPLRDEQPRLALLARGEQAVAVELELEQPAAS